MTKKNKRFLKLLQCPREIRYPELDAVLCNFNYRHVRTKGSHYVYKKSQHTDITFPVHHNNVKGLYIRKIIDILNSQEL